MLTILTPGRLLSMRRGSCTICLCSNVRHLGVGMELVKVLLVACGCRFDGFVTRVPVSGADLINKRQYACKD